MLLRMSKVDKDGDGLVTVEEYVEAGGAAKHFNEFDWNNDGVLDKAEQLQAEQQTAPTAQARGATAERERREK